MKRLDASFIEKYANEMKESGYNQNNSYTQIAVLDYAQTKYQEIENTLQNENVENREELEAKRDEWRVYVIPVLYVITSIISIKITTVTQSKKKDENKKEDIIIDPEGKKEEEIDPTAQMEQMNKSMMYMVPFMSVMIAIIAPLGLALYWLVSNVLMIIERLVITKIMDKKEENKEEKSNV